jgi:hypothetical protein
VYSNNDTSNKVNVFSQPELGIKLARYRIRYFVSLFFAGQYEPLADSVRFFSGMRFTC